MFGDQLNALLVKTPITLSILAVGKRVAARPSRAVPALRAGMMQTGAVSCIETNLFSSAQDVAIHLRKGARDQRERGVAYPDMYVDVVLPQMRRLLDARIDCRSRIGVRAQRHDRVRLLRTHELLPEEARLAPLLLSALERFERFLAVEEGRRVGVVGVELPEGGHCVQDRFLQLIERERVFDQVFEEGAELRPLRVFKTSEDGMTPLFLALHGVLRIVCQFSSSPRAGRALCAVDAQRPEKASLPHSARQRVLFEPRWGDLLTSFGVSRPRILYLRSGPESRELERGKRRRRIRVATFECHLRSHPSPDDLSSHLLDVSGFQTCSRSHGSSVQPSPRALLSASPTCSRPQTPPDLIPWRRKARAARLGRPPVQG